LEKIQAMIKLTLEQELAVKKWAKDGYGLSEIQKSLLSEFKISATYMEIKEKRAAPASQIVAESGAGPGAGRPERQSRPASDNQPSAAAGQVSVELDHVMRAGSVVSGTVLFSDGVSASWSLDQLGRLSLDAGNPGYSPSQQDIKVFQQELKKELEKRGF
jgi:hypothetical protein